MTEKQLEQTAEYRRAYRAAQAGGMSETECGEFALDQARRVAALRKFRNTPSLEATKELAEL